MSAAPVSDVVDQHILVVEDEWSTAVDIANAFRCQGATIVGPVSSIDGALRLIEKERVLHGAVLDINLQGELAFSVADALAGRGIPFVFATCHGRSAIPAKYHDVPRCAKPFEFLDLVRVLALFRSASRGERKARCQALLRNVLLASLDPASLGRLQQDLEQVQLPLRSELEHANLPAGRYCYFLTSGIASVTITGRNRENLEIGMIGREGICGLSALGTDRPSSRSTMLVSGSGERISATQLRSLLDINPAMAHALRQFSQAFLDQISLNLLAAARSSVEERVARWLLMFSDRSDRDKICATHENVAALLGVRRAGVTAALQTLESKGCIGSGRGEIAIVDRQALINATGGCYKGPPERLVGQS